MRPFATSLLEAVEATAQLAHELAAAAVDPRRGAHVEIFVDGRLQVGLPNVERSEVVITRSGNGEDKPDGKSLDDGGKDAIEINSVLLRVPVGDEARLELIDGPVSFAFDCKDKVAVHDIGAGGQRGERHKVPRFERNEAGELFGNRLSPLLGLRTRHGLAIALRNS